MAYPVTLNGTTYTLASFEGLNYVDGFPDALEDFVTHAANVYSSTSTTSVAIGTGSKTFTIADSGKPYAAGTPLRFAASSDPSNKFMDGVVTSYSGTTVVLDVKNVTGSGTLASWNVSIGGGTALFNLPTVTASSAELNILDGATLTTAELNTLAGVTATTAELNYLDITTLGTSEASKAVTADANGVVTFDNGTIEEVTSITSSSNAATINLRDGNLFEHDLTENVTYTFSNPAATGRASIFALKVIQGSSTYAITWPTSVDWAGGSAPTLSSSNDQVDVFILFTIDGGTTYYGFTAGQDLN